MSDSPLQVTTKTVIGGKQSLGRTLLVWLLMLALLPLTISSWFAYNQAQETLEQAAVLQMVQGALAKTRYIDSWFDYRFMDLSSQAESQRNADFLIELSDAQLASNKTTKLFTRSFAWARIIDKHQHDLVTLSRRYDYISNIMLANVNGDVLFTSTEKALLGINLFQGQLTDLGGILKSSLSSGQMLFSDIVRENQSGTLSSYISAPVLNEWGDKIGLIIFEIRLDRLYEQMLETPGNTLRHYLVGEDGLLRTSLDANTSGNILSKRIDTAQFKDWLEHLAESDLHSDSSEEAIEYLGPRGKQVIGLHHNISIGGVNWVLISEIDKDEALSEASHLAWVTMIILLITSALVTGLAFILARRITRPLIKLADASLAASQGKTVPLVNVDVDNEIGVLANAFNQMQIARRQHEKEITDAQDKTEQILNELKEQKFALMLPRLNPSLESAQFHSFY